MYFIGLMSGTSVDAIDAALVEINEKSISVLQYDQYPVPPHIQTAIRSITRSCSISSITELDVILGNLFAEAVNNILAASAYRREDILAVGSHGQTVLHLPEGDYPRTMQIGDPNIIAFKTGITTVADFRRLDIAAGGQGAPLAPGFHAWYFRSKDINRIVLNLGGMANITILPAESERDIYGFDTGPGNALMDNWIQRHRKRDYDHNGVWAGSGTCNTELLDILRDDPYFKKPAPKSTGRDEFNLDWLEQKLCLLDERLRLEDVQATLLEFTTRTISEAITYQAPDTQEILMCGGGIHNTLLVKRLRALLPGFSIASTAQYGIHPDAVEAVTFAWLAKCRLENIPANIPTVTGAIKQVVLGGIYPG